MNKIKIYTDKSLKLNNAVLKKVDIEKYQLRKLNSVSGKNIFSISSAGEYLISESKAEHFRINIIWVIGAAGVILAMTVIYIFTKRKYWFW